MCFGTFFLLNVKCEQYKYYTHYKLIVLLLVLVIHFLSFQLRACLRTYVHEQMVQAANSTAGVRTIKRVDQTLEDFGVCFISSF